MCHFHTFRIIYVIVVILIGISTAKASTNPTIQDYKDSLTVIEHDTTRINILNQIGLLYIDSSFAEAHHYIDYADSISVVTSYPLGNGTSRYNRARCFAFQTKYTEAISEVDKALDILSNVPYANDKIASCYLLKGWIFDKIGKYYNALQNYEKAANIFNKLDDNNGLANSLINIGIIHDHLGNLDTSLEYYERSKELYLSVGNKRGLVYVYNNIGHIGMLRKQDDSAIDNYTKGLELAKELNFPMMEATIQANLAEIYINNNDLEKARIYNKEAGRINHIIKDERGIAYYQLQSATIEYKANRANPMVSMVESANKEAIRMGELELQKDCATHLQEVYKDQGNFEKALSYNIIAHALEDSIKADEVRFKTKNMELTRQFEAEESDKRLAQQMKQSGLQQKIQAQKSVRNLLILGLASLLFLATFLFYFYRQKVNINTELAQKNSALRNSEEVLESKNADLEKYIEMNIQLEQFAHIASHDIKAPLRTISSFIGLLKKSLSTSIGAREKEYFSIVETSARRLDDLVDDLLQYATVNSQKMNIQAFEIDELIESVVNDLQYRIATTTTKITIDTSVKSITADMTMLRQVLQNLIDNAVKFSVEDRASEITISSEEDDNFFYISIADNGIGVIEEYTDQIFDQFTQLNTKDQYEGTGLGLSICRRYMTKHHGSISVRKNEPHGSIFTCSISKSLTS